MSDVRDLLSLFVGLDAVPEATVAYLTNVDTKIRTLSQQWSNKTFKLHSTPENPSDSSTYNVNCNDETDQWVDCGASSLFPLPLARFTAELLRTRGPTLIPLTKVKLENFPGARERVDTLLSQNTQPQLRLAVGHITAENQRVDVYLHSDLGVRSQGRSNHRVSSPTHSFSYTGLIKSEAEHDAYYTSWIVGRSRPTLIVNGAPFDWGQPEEMEVYGMLHSSVAHETDEEDDAFYGLIAEARGSDTEQY